MTFSPPKRSLSAGDPGPVILRRLSNAEYNYTIADLTGVDALNPTREFPVDGAAGEGFTNVGSGQGMSPALVQKYLDAGKEVAEHLVLLPDGIRFSPFTTQRDQTDDLMARIQAFYRRFTKDGGGAKVNLQGIQFDTNQGGLLPLEEYLAATLAERDALTAGKKTIEAVARERSLSPKYLASLWGTLNREPQTNGSLPIDVLRANWRKATPQDAVKLAGDVAEAQKTLWKFNTVGQIGRADGPRSWMEAVSPIATTQDLRLKLPAAPAGSDVVIYLTASQFGEGDERAHVVWQRPRIELPPAPAGPRPPILLRNVRSQAKAAEGTIASDIARTRQYLDAVAQMQSASTSAEELAKASGLDARILGKWAARVRLGKQSRVEIAGHFTEKLKNRQFEAISGWGTSQTPLMLTNRSDKPITIGTLTVPARGVTVHPSPTREAIVAWRSPTDGEIQIEGRVADADDKCGNGATWRIELQTVSGSEVLASGVIDNGGEESFRMKTSRAIKAGDVVSLIVNARDRNHSCDTTHVELKLSEVGNEKRVWNLASDVVDKVLEGNPLADSYGNKETWHFCSAESGSSKASVEPLDALIPPDSSLARWRAAVVDAKPADEIQRLATVVQGALTTADAAKLNEPDKTLRERFLTGLDAERFGKHPGGAPLEPADLCLPAPQILEVRLPAELVAGGEFITTGVLHAESGKEGGVQLQLLTGKPDASIASPGTTILVRPSSEGQRRTEAAMKEFRDLFPPALCYARIVPVDEVVTLKLFYREDDQLKRLMLNDEQAAEIDRLWAELFYVSQEPLKLAVSLEQIAEFATQDNPAGAKAFAAMRRADQRPGGRIPPAADQDGTVACRGRAGICRPGVAAAVD